MSFKVETEIKGYINDVGCGFCEHCIEIPERLDDTPYYEDGNFLYCGIFKVGLLTDYKSQGEVWGGMRCTACLESEIKYIRKTK